MSETALRSRERAPRRRRPAVSYGSVVLCFGDDLALRTTVGCVLRPRLGLRPLLVTPERRSQREHPTTAMLRR